MPLTHSPARSSTHFTVAPVDFRDSLPAMRFTAQLLATLLALVALGQVQVFGWVKSYWCPCNPSAQAVLTSQCEAAICHPHSDHEEGDAPSSEKGADEDHRHLAWSDSNAATSPTSGTDRLVTPALVWAWEIHPLEIPGVRPREEQPPQAPPESPPTSLLGIRSTVILV
ncbi:MAG: hypothetical protein J0M24_03035 [Verrucomicrobia bacterium]|nr:hypothetical protein [Verrucomicrobiota bacterium]